MKRRALLLATVLPLLAGCSHINTHVAPDAHLDRVRHVYVEHEISDGRNLDQTIAKEFQKLGYDASAGPLTMAPPDADVIVSYVDEWTFDFTTYMIRLDIRVRDAATAKPLAEAAFYRPSITGKSAADMVRIVITSKHMFRPKVPPVPEENHDE